MPLYEYECLKTGKRFEILQKFSDPPLTECPDEDCDGQVRKLLSPPAIQFKGSGWYVTDYARSGDKDGAKKEAKTEAGDSTSEKKASKSDSSAKSEAKSSE